MRSPNPLPTYPPCPVSRLPGPCVRLFESEESNRLQWEEAKTGGPGEPVTVDLKADLRRALADRCRESATVRMAPEKEIVDRCRADTDIAPNHRPGVQPPKSGDS